MNRRAPPARAARHALREPDRPRRPGQLLERRATSSRSPSACCTRPASSGASSTRRGATLRAAPTRATSINRNTLCSADPDVNGVKTGHTLDAGYVLVGSATRNGVAADLGRARRAERGRARRRHRAAARLRLLALRSAARRSREGEPLARPRARDQDEDAAAGRRPHGARRRARRRAVATQVDAPDEVEGPIAAGERLGSGTVTRRRRARSTRCRSSPHARPPRRRRSSSCAPRADRGGGRRPGRRRDTAWRRCCCAVGPRIAADG